jgi:hypothetical protein
MKIRFKYLLISIALIYNSYDLIAQGIGINSTGALANNDAGLDVDFANKGILIPRVNLINLTTFNPPITNNGNTTSLLVFNTNNAIGQGYYYWDGTQWVKLITEFDAWMLDGNAGTTPTTNFIGTTDNADLVIRTNNNERFRIFNTGEVSINSPINNADAGLNINFNDKGVLIPRVNLVNLTTFNPPITNNGNTVSLLVYNTNIALGEGFYYWNGTQWVKLITGFDAWMLTGNAGTTSAVNFIGTTDNADFVIRTNNTERVRILSSGNIGVNITNPVLSVQINQTDAIGIPSGTTAQRPTTPPVGSLRFNTTTGVTEVFNGTCWQNVNTPPIGATYIQWFNAADPNTIYPCTQWVATDIANGEFIRARGGNSNVPANTALTGTVQQHAMQQHQHTATVTINNATGLVTNAAGSHLHTFQTRFHGTSSDGLCQNCVTYFPLGGDDFPWPDNINPFIATHNTSVDGNHTHTIPDHNHTGTVTVNNVSAGANTASETRPTNVAVIFWRRIN